MPFYRCGAIATRMFLFFHAISFSRPSSIMILLSADYCASFVFSKHFRTMKCVTYSCGIRKRVREVLLSLADTLIKNKRAFVRFRKCVREKLQLVFFRIYFAYDCFIKFLDALLTTFEFGY